MNDKTNFIEIVNAWLAEKELQVKSSSIAAYKLSLEKHIIPYFQTSQSLTKKNIQEFVDLKIKEGLSVKRIKDILVVLKMVMKAINGDDRELEIKIPNIYKEKNLPVFTLDQQKRLMKHLGSHFSYKNLGILICINTGLRIGEICALKWKDIDLDQGTLSVNKTIYRIYWGSRANKKTELVISTPKTKNSYRTVPLPDALKELLKNLSINNREYYVLTDSDYPVEPRTYRVYFQRLLKSLSLPNIKFHGLRHSFATRCIESNCDYKSVSAILGHSDITTTLNLYVHPTYDQKKNCIEKMLKMLKDQ